MLDDDPVKLELYRAVKLALPVVREKLDGVWGRCATPEGRRLQDLYGKLLDALAHAERE